MLCEPVASVDRLKVACPAAFRDPVPIVVEPSLNVTIPVGVPAMEGVTVAAKVTSCPSKEGLGVPTTVVVVGILFTVWVSITDVLLWKFTSPL